MNQMGSSKQHKQNHSEQDQVADALCTNPHLAVLGYKAHEHALEWHVTVRCLAQVLQRDQVVPACLERGKRARSVR